MNKEEQDNQTRAEVLEIMDMEEIKRRLRSPMEYKFINLIVNFSDSEERHKGNDEIIEYCKDTLKELENMEERINELFELEFCDEPKDEEIELFRGLEK